MGVGAPANARDIIYDPFFGNNGELITAAPDGRSYVPADGVSTLTRQSGHAVASGASNWSIDPGPQFSADVDITGTFLLSASLGNNRVYGRLTNTTSVLGYYADWNPTTGVFQVGYRDGTGAHILTGTSPGVAGVAGASHTIRLRCISNGILADLDGGGGSKSTSATDTRYTSGLVGFALFQTDNYLETYQCLRG